MNAESRHMLGLDDLFLTDLYVKERALFIKDRLVDIYRKNPFSKKIPFTTPDHCLPDLVMDYIKAKNSEKLQVCY